MISFLGQTFRLFQIFPRLIVVMPLGRDDREVVFYGRVSRINFMVFLKNFQSLTGSSKLEIGRRKLHEPATKLGIFFEQFFELFLLR